MEKEIEGLHKLEALAGHLDQLPKGSYFQGDWNRCAAGNYFRSRGMSHPGMHIMDEGYRAGGIFQFLANEFSTTVGNAFKLFGCNGCGNAHRDPQKAARYIREFVQHERVLLAA